MVVDPNPFLKLWWKSVDIIANVISATISAAVVAWFARRFIKWKHDGELKLEERKREIHRKGRWRTLENAKQAYWAHAVTLENNNANPLDVKRLFTEYRKWMEDNSLHNFGENRKRFDAMMKMEESGGGIDTLILGRLSQDIKGTALPDPGKDLGFPW